MTPQEFFKKDLFAEQTGVELLEVREGYSKACLVITENHLNAGHRTQGGAIFTLADLALAAAANSHGSLAFSLSSNITFLRASGPGDTLYAELLRDIIHAHAEGIQPNGKITERLTYCDSDRRGSRADGWETGWNETNGALMALEIPGIYVRTDLGKLYVFDHVEAEIMKSRSLSGSAYIDFPVDQTAIYPDYRRNTVELGKIQATIDSVRNDKDVSITSVWLKGFASPESPYKHNTELAIGRTAALKKHIGQLYRFADNIIRTEYEPEDWAGLRRQVEQSNINHRGEILALIDSDMEPDAKEAKIKRTYPEEYRFMLQHFYPALRHTDYRIDYAIRTFSEVEEIKRIMAEQPQKLSQNEFYLVAGKYEPGTDEFTDVFETAVRMFPNDEIANLNAANAAIRRDDFGTARRYLDKAGDSPEAEYARGALAVREGDYETARRYLNKAKEMGFEKAGRTLDELNERLQ